MKTLPAESAGLTRTLRVEFPYHCDDTYIYIYTLRYPYMYRCVYIYNYTYIQIHIYIYIYIHKYIHIHIHIHINVHIAAAPRRARRGSGPRRCWHRSTSCRAPMRCVRISTYNKSVCMYIYIYIAILHLQVGKHPMSYYI